MRVLTCAMGTLHLGSSPANFKLAHYRPKHFIVFHRKIGYHYQVSEKSGREPWTHVKDWPIKPLGDIAALADAHQRPRGVAKHFFPWSAHNRLKRLVLTKRIQGNTRFAIWND